MGGFVPRIALSGLIYYIYIYVVVQLVKESFKNFRLEPSLCAREGNADVLAQSTVQESHRRTTVRSLMLVVLLLSREAKMAIF